MPATHAPSIFLQRIIVVVILAAIGAMAWWQSAGGRSDVVVEKFSKSPSPALIDALDFTSAEAGWRQLQIDAEGNLIIDALTESALLEAITLIDPASELPQARLEFLLEKQFGSTASRQIMDLLPILKDYKEAEQRWWGKNGNKHPPPHAQLIRLQDEMFGEALARKMFAEQRRLLNAMLASHRIRSDAELTPAQQDQALSDLEKTIQHQDASIE